MTATTANGQRIATTGTNGRRSQRGFSVRRMLENQGVTTELGIRKHLTFITNTLQSNPDFDATTYRVNPNNPNSGLPYHG